MLDKLLLRGNSISLSESTVCLLIFNIFGIKHSFWISIFSLLKHIVPRILMLKKLLIISNVSLLEFYISIKKKIKKSGGQFYVPFGQSTFV